MLLLSISYSGYASTHGPLVLLLLLVVLVFLLRVISLFLSTHAQKHSVRLKFTLLSHILLKGTCHMPPLTDQTIFIITHQHPRKNHCILHIMKHSHIYTTSIESASIQPDISTRTLQAQAHGVQTRKFTLPIWLPRADCTGGAGGVMSSMTAAVNQCRHPTKLQPFSVRKRQLLCHLRPPNYHLLSYRATHVLQALPSPTQNHWDIAYF